MDNQVRTHGFLDFSQQQVHDIVARYLSGYLHTVENDALQKVLEDEKKRIFFSFSWLNGQPDTFLQVTINDEPVDSVEEQINTAEEEQDEA